MPAPAEIVLPETKPETEWIRGRALRKVSPTYRHAALQGILCALLREWARRNERGRVGTEWRFRVNPPGEVIRPVVPDVAYLSYGRLALDRDAEAQVPLGAPSVAFEILSPDDRAPDVESKTATYLKAGCELVAIVDPETETIAAFDGSGSATFARGAIFEHAALPGFTFDVAALFHEALH